MKKLLLSALSATLLAFGSNYAAASVVKVKNASKSHISTLAVNNNSSYDFVVQLGGFYAPPTTAGNTTGNYYTVLSTSNDASYDSTSGEIHAQDAMVLMLDLYAPVTPTNDLTITPGTYMYSNEDVITEPFRYGAYSMLAYYDENGKMADNTSFDGPITITDNGNGKFTVSTTITYNQKSVSLSYTGPLTYKSENEAGTNYPQIRQNLDLKLDKGGKAIYYGNLFKNNTGNIYINCYDNSFDPETGSMNEDGTSISLCMFARKFGKYDKPHPLAGEYDGNRTLARGTWLVGMELIYADMPVIIGTYVRQRVNGQYRYAYLKTGKVVIEELGGNEYKITVDAVTDLGFTVKAVCTGEIITSDEREPDPVCISTLDSDVDLDLDKIPVCRIYHNGIRHNYRSLVLDIGSPSGMDEELANGGDIMRLEFILDPSDARLREGTYTVMEQNYSSYFAPFKLCQGYFSEKGNGELVGTRYNHFKENSYWVYDQFAPAKEGTVGVTHNPDDTWTFDINLIDDAGYYLAGKWTGPMIYRYNPDSIADIATISTDDDIEVQYNNGTLRVLGIEDGTTVNVYSLSGVLAHSFSGSNESSLSHLAKGVYIIKIKNHISKIVR